MKLLTKEEALALKPGDKVKVYWFKARQSYEEKFIDGCWHTEVIDSVPRLATHSDDGVSVKLERGELLFNALKMELLP